MPIRKSNGMIGAKETGMKLKDAIEKLAACKSWDEFERAAPYYDARLHATYPRLPDADWARWDEAKDRTRTRLANLMRAG